MKTLVIGEKPAVAADIAKALGVPKAGDWFENDELIVSCCVGHLVELFFPEAEKRGAPLPLIPTAFSLRAVEKTEKQFRLVAKLMNRSDVGTVVNACDAGREGEAIFRLVYELAGCKKNMQRMWLQSMTKSGIQSAWKGRSPGSDYDDLADAARSRAEADWLVGINGTRSLNDAVGRVMTPTLALIVRRFIENRDFVPVDYFEVFATVELKSGEYKSKWIPKAEDKAKLITDRSICDQLVAKCAGKNPSAIKDDSKPQKKAPPFLFDLTSLQREANRKFKFSAAKTLSIAQALYEKHKATSYPRTDSQRLPEDYVPTCKKVVSALASLPGLAAHAAAIESNGWVRPSKRIFDDSKISDHFAIIPTGVIPAGLSADEQKIYDLVAKRFLAIFFPDAEYFTTVRTTILSDEVFRATGSVLVSEGWMVVYGKEESSRKNPDETDLPKLQEGEQGKTTDVSVVKKRTKAPELYSEATLLTAMETAGKALDDQDLSDAMKERGLGTPATRAATIEKLLKPGKDKEAYVLRNGTSLVPTERALSLISYLETASPKLVSVELTGTWEYLLSLMEKGQAPREKFMSGIEVFVRELVSQSAGRRPQAAPSATVSFEPVCPLCGDAMVLDGRVIRHAEPGDCQLEVWTVVSRKQISEESLRQLLSDRKTGVVSGFVSKEGRQFSAALVITDAGKVEFSFDAAETKYACPACSKALKQNGKKLECSCGFSLWMEVASKKLAEEDIRDLLTNGRTKVLSGFLSQRKTKFSAAIVLGDRGATSFEFSNAQEESSGREKAAKSGDKCPTCGKGKLINRQTGEGKPFVGCTTYPACRHFEWAK